MLANHRLHAGDSERERGPPSSGSAQAGAYRFPDNAQSNDRVTFVLSLTRGDPAVTDYIVRTRNFSGTHFLRTS